MFVFVSKRRNIRSIVIESLAWAVQDNVPVDNTRYPSSYIYTNLELMAELEVVIVGTDAVEEDRYIRELEATKCLVHMLSIATGSQ